MDPVQEYGWTAQPRDPAIVLRGQKNIKDPQPQSVQDINLPDTALAKSIMEYARRELPEQTFNHSMRVYYYGMDSTRTFFGFFLAEATLTNIQEKRFNCSSSPPGS